MENLEREIIQKMPTAVTCLLTKKKVLHIRDLDEVVTEQEIRDAISVSAESFQVNALRPAYGNQHKVTLIMNDADNE